MADENGSGTHTLINNLAAAPWEFDFFQAVRQLECAHQGIPAISKALSPKEEYIRFCQEPSLNFAPSSIAAFRPQGPESPAKMFVNFFGLLGPNGPLPLHLTEYAHDRSHHFGDKTLARFFDIFHHRMISLFYRAWAMNRKAVSYDRPDTDRYFIYIGSLLGLGMKSLQKRDTISDTAKLFFSGHLTCHTRHADGLQAILSNYYDIPVQVNEFFCHWIDVPPESYCYMGKSRDTGILGRTVIVGSRIWNCQNKFRIRMGPMDFQQYQRMLPGGQGYKRLIGWVRNYAGDRFDWDVQLILKAREVPPVQLGKMGRMGWSSWLVSKPLQADVDSCVLQPDAA
ncbi:MAG: type VI secretion system baseplate subunit TssG [Sedimentisphaerales bacterium]|nr:type VI secretion system baseplate subunit TssG [Sedimentisphaerales bacterium]